MPSKRRFTEARTTGTRAGVDEDLLDDKNRLLLAELQVNPRITMSALARQVSMSAPAVTERVEWLEQTGVIRGYRTDVDPAALGLPLTVFARIKPAAGQLTKLAELAAATPQVVECHRITGEDCFLLKVHAATVEHLAEILDRFQVFGQSVTSVVVSTPVPLRPLPIPASGEQLTHPAGVLRRAQA